MLMIAETVKNLFDFISFLHSNMAYLLDKQPLINRVMELHASRSSLKPNQNYQDRIKFNRVQADLENNFDIVKKEIISIITDKIQELNIADISTPIINLNASRDLFELQRNFNEDDLAAIFEANAKYVEFRKKMNFHYFLEFFFNDLDRDLKQFFNYFNEKTDSEFEAFETKTVQVNSIEEAVEQFQIGNKKVTLPIDFLTPSKVQHPSSEVKPAYSEERSSEKNENEIKSNKDVRFWLTSLFEEQEQTKYQYKSLQRQIDNNGCLIVNIDIDSVKIFTPELAVILTSKELPARNMDNQIETKINGFEYLDSYVKGYREGEKHFENEFKVSADTLYGDNAEQYVRDIHANFFHARHGGNEGWGYVKKQYPFILTHSAVNQFGFYSGIVNKVEEQIQKHPRLFSTFDKCEHDLQSDHAETKTDKVKGELNKYGFFELSMVKQISEPNKQALIELICVNDLPYSIAMLDFTGFLRHLKAQYFTTDYQLFKTVAKWFNVTDRAVKGNINVLKEFSKENRKRYTADQQKQAVQNDYEKLK